MRDDLSVVETKGTQAIPGLSELIRRIEHRSVADSICGISITSDNEMKSKFNLTSVPSDSS
jgi:hypothetical protein